MSLKIWCESAGYDGSEPGEVPELTGYGIGFSREDAARDVAREVGELGIEATVVRSSRSGGWYVMEVAKDWVPSELVV